MAKTKKKLWIFAVFLLFLLYFFIAARPIPKETVLKIRWLSSLESGETLFPNDSSSIPGAGGREAGENKHETLEFTLGGRFGYLDTDGRFITSEIKQDNLSLSRTKWAMYDAAPDLVEIRSNDGEVTEVIENPQGYPFFLDNRTFILGTEQNSISQTDGRGSFLWTYEFASTVICADAANGYLLTGSIDGVIEMLDAAGRQVFSFEPGGSRYALILSCAFSADASRFAVISGVEEQRFLLFERLGSARETSAFGLVEGSNVEYRVVYHEFLGNGFRRPMHISFIDGDSKVIFEREGGICIYEINSRKSYYIILEGEIAAIDHSGSGGQFFVIVNSPSSGQKKLVGLNLPQKIFVQAPFKSDGVFLGRSGSLLFIGGGETLACFDLEKK